MKSQSIGVRPHAMLCSFALLCCMALPARANFRICNNSPNRMSVAMAYSNGKGWVSEGWWNLKPAACDEILRGPLAAEFYYVYAMDEHGGEWKGKTFMCTLTHEFKIDGRQDCFARSFDRTGFIEVDTGKDAKNWTINLTDPSAPPTQVAPALKLPVTIPSATPSQKPAASTPPAAPKP